MDADVLATIRCAELQELQVEGEHAEVVLLKAGRGYTCAVRRANGEMEDVKQMIAIHTRTLVERRKRNAIEEAVGDFVASHKPRYEDMMVAFGAVLAGVEDTHAMPHAHALLISAIRSAGEGLTKPELWRAMSSVAQEWAASAVRAERHPDDLSKKADEA